MVIIRKMEGSRWIDKAIARVAILIGCCAEQSVANILGKRALEKIGLAPLDVWLRGADSIIVAIIPFQRGRFSCFPLPLSGDQTRCSSLGNAQCFLHILSNKKTLSFENGEDFVFSFAQLSRGSAGVDAAFRFGYMTLKALPHIPMVGRTAASS